MIDEEDWPIVAKYGNWRDEGIYVTISFPNGKQYVGLVKETLTETTVITQKIERYQRMLSVNESSEQRQYILGVIKGLRIALASIEGEEE